jgi:hypothetical protein
MLSAS